MRKLFLAQVVYAMAVFSATNLFGDSKVEIAPAFPQLRFIRPLEFRISPEDPRQVFIVEQAGRILTFSLSEESKQAEVFLDIRARVNDRGEEEGLLGLAFHPDYARNGLFFLYYTADPPRRAVVAKFRRKTKQSALPDSEEVILEIAQPYSNHNGGSLVFGPDGHLYLGVGDGGAAGDPHGHGQDLSTLLGSLLRLDVNRAESARKYSIPADNPFLGKEGARAEIYAYGLRNPWRFSFDRATGKLWLADVGQNRVEEINVIEKGGNYGWNTMEGTLCFSPPLLCAKDGLARPVFEYGRGDGASITGGFVYRGRKLKALVGKYIYGDYVSGRVWALSVPSQGSVSNELLLETGLNISSFGEDGEGELYLCSFDGAIYRLTGR